MLLCKFEQTGLWQRLYLQVKLFLCDWIVIQLLMLCGRGRREALSCPTAGAGLNSPYAGYHEANVA